MNNILATFTVSFILVTVYGAVIFTRPIRHDISKRETCTEDFMEEAQDFFAKVMSSLTNNGSDSTCCFKLSGDISRFSCKKCKVTGMKALSLIGQNPFTCSGGNSSLSFTVGLNNPLVTCECTRSILITSNKANFYFQFKNVEASAVLTFPSDDSTKKTVKDVSIFSITNPVIDIKDCNFLCILEKTWVNTFQVTIVRNIITKSLETVIKNRIQKYVDDVEHALAVSKKDDESSQVEENHLLVESDQTMPDNGDLEEKTNKGVINTKKTDTVNRNSDHESQEATFINSETEETTIEQKPQSVKTEKDSISTTTKATTTGKQEDEQSVESGGVDSNPNNNETEIFKLNVSRIITTAKEDEQSVESGGVDSNPNNNETEIFKLNVSRIITTAKENKGVQSIENNREVLKKDKFNLITKSNESQGDRAAMSERKEFVVTKDESETDKHVIIQNDLKLPSKEGNRSTVHEQLVDEIKIDQGIENKSKFADDLIGEGETPAVESKDDPKLISVIEDVSIPDQSVGEVDDESAVDEIKDVSEPHEIFNNKSKYDTFIENQNESQAGGPKPDQLTEDQSKTNIFLEEEEEPIDSELVSITKDDLQPHQMAVNESTPDKSSEDNHVPNVGEQDATENKNVSKSNQIVKDKSKMNVSGENEIKGLLEPNTTLDATEDKNETGAFNDKSKPNKVVETENLSSTKIKNELALKAENELPGSELIVMVSKNDSKTDNLSTEFEYDKSKGIDKIEDIRKVEQPIVFELDAEPRADDSNLVFNKVEVNVSGSVSSSLNNIKENNESSVSETSLKPIVGESSLNKK
ncbi:uncharacterized protein LOC143227060 [Tachypleus tridentatus]|uniref:uncharacterized protein LOC143227060 n=1 Tax=Tachypleus tridentatus TaxID=6853 RepID=UPI003FD3DB56